MITFSKKLERHLMTWHEIMKVDCSPEDLGRLIGQWMKKAMTMVSPPERPEMQKWLTDFIKDWAARDDDPPGFSA